MIRVARKPAFLADHAEDHAEVASRFAGCNLRPQGRRETN
ncbi:hypothetical protein CPter91_2285 [Collimonas pratensis]|uniref:Uncharacterized protein n=1 Tax=Collimonas pratensis TaxID=279113 RepID=A0A127Q3I8_9BURK|nr:hypothetical protein CPter91_2285 [Collimonas pratensis]